jgi:hypothetical protein
MLDQPVLGGQSTDGQLGELIQFYRSPGAASIHSGDVREPPGVRGNSNRQDVREPPGIRGNSKRQDSFRRRQGTTRSQGQQQETELIQETSGNHQESGATARDSTHSGDVREPPGVRGYRRRQE